MGRCGRALRDREPHSNKSDEIYQIVGKNHGPERHRSSEHEYKEGTDHRGQEDISEARPPMIATEYERSGGNGYISIAQARLQHMPGALSKDDLLTDGNQRQAEDEIGQMQPAAWFGIAVSFWRRTRSS